MSNIQDDIDRMLQGEDTPSASQAQTQGQQDDSIQRIEQQTEEEIEFNKLSGPAQERFRSALVRARDAEERLRELESQRFVPQQPQNTLAPDQKQAIDTLSQFGIATDEKVDTKVNEGINKVLNQLKTQSLETKYSGQDGTPQFVREEVEDFVRTHPQYKAYDPEDVFRYKMYPDEFASAGTRQTTKPHTSSFKPTKSSPQANPFADMDALQARLAQPDGDEYYEAHKDEINAAVATHTQKFKGVNFGGQ